MEHDTTGERTRCFLKASIVFNHRMSSIDCIVRNISKSGARLEVDGSLAIPQTFDLEIPDQGSTYRATACWRDIDAIGVDFAAVPGAESRLVAENRELREQVEFLTRQLHSPAEA